MHVSATTEFPFILTAPSDKSRINRSANRVNCLSWNLVCMQRKVKRLFRKINFVRQTCSHLSSESEVVECKWNCKIITHSFVVYQNGIVLEVSRRIGLERSRSDRIEKSNEFYISH